MKQKKHIGLAVALVVICVAAVAVFLKAADMYRNTHQKLNDILTLAQQANQPAPEEETPH